MMSDPPDLETARRNRSAWEAESAEYQRRHSQDLAGERARAWGIWRLPEDELRVLDDIVDKDVLELGCGAAQWAAELALGGARAVGIDISTEQLRHARSLVDDRGAEVALVQGAAERLPLAPESFDVIVSDYGAMIFADPYLTVPECARVLRPGGQFAFSTTGPFLVACWTDEDEDASKELQRSYFGMHRLEWPGEEAVDFALTYGDWVRLFRDNRFVIEDLIEVQPPDDAETTYEGRPLWWARRWPAELIWKLRKEA